MGWISREYLPAVARGGELPGRYPAWQYTRLVQLTKHRLRQQLLNRLAVGLRSLERTREGL